MLLGRIAGTVVASRKEPLMEGWRLLVVQQLGVDNAPTGGVRGRHGRRRRGRRRGRALRLGLVGPADRGHPRSPVRRGDHGDRRHVGSRRRGGLPQVAMVDEREINDVIERVRRRVGEPGPQLARRAAVQESLAGPSASASRRRRLPDPRRGDRRGDRRPARHAPRARPAQDDHRLDPACRASSRRRCWRGWRSRRPASAASTTRSLKNRLVTDKTPGPEDLEVQAVTGADGMMVTEWAPFGVIGAITPVTNPTSTIIYNAIAMVSAGNAVVFNVHPSARRSPMRRCGSSTGRSWTPAGRPTSSCRRRAHHRVGPHADVASRCPAAPRDRRPGRRPRGAEERQAGDHGGSRQPAGRGRRDGRHREGRRATSSWARRSTTTSSAPTRRRRSSSTRSPTGSSARWRSTARTSSRSTSCASWSG